MCQPDAVDRHELHTPKASDRTLQDIPGRITPAHTHMSCDTVRKSSD